MQHRVILGWLADVDSSAPDLSRLPNHALHPPVSPSSSGKQTPGNDISRSSRKRAFTSTPDPRRPSEPIPRRVALGSMDANAAYARRTSPRKHKPTAPIRGTADNHDESKHDTHGQTPQDSMRGVYSDDLQATPRPPRSTSSRSQYVMHLSETTALPPTTASASHSSRTSRTRSTSPVRRAGDLLKLSKPVQWVQLSPKALSERVAGTKQPSAISLFDKIKRVIRSNKGYLPKQLQEPLRAELELSDDDAYRFAVRDPLPLSHEVLARRKIKARRILGPTAKDEDLSSFVQVTEPLERELEQLQEIVDRTGAFKTVPRAEPTWNEQIHAPMLDLAVRDHHHVVYENVTRANIAGTFLPHASAEISLPLGTKMIDYVMAISGEEAIGTGLDDLPQRIRTFASKLTPDIFNQTNYESLRNCPTGVFIETKVDSMSGWSEGKAQLGFWLASWFKRIGMFPRPNRGPDIAMGSKSLGGLPFFPVILVVGDKWELHLAFEEDSGFCIYGGLDIGGTGGLDDAYRLLAVLRILVQDWMAGEFRTWVESQVI
ncbi:hypothetical protein GGR57DRAFT_334889 [Xylariaceae sp. FL1272]|nr:hypothetical protein GGR57DRAFT_334889 [Xylariaceae sp. FL1272]